MKTGLTIEELATEIMRQRDVKTDYIVDTTKLCMENYDTSLVLRVLGDNGTDIIEPLDFDDEKKRIALGLKQLTPHPWDALDTDLKVGDKVKGKVVVMADYGAFIEIATGVEGLIHVSEMSWSCLLYTSRCV